MKHSEVKNIGRAAREFEHRFGAQVRRSSQVIRRPSAPDYAPGDFYGRDFDYWKQTYTVVEEYAVDITISERDFERLVDICDEFSDSNRQWQEYKLICKHDPHWLSEYTHLQSVDRCERRVRDAVPAVQQAWEHYQLLLKLNGG